MSTPKRQRKKQAAAARRAAMLAEMQRRRRRRRLLLLSTVAGLVVAGTAISLGTTWFDRPEATPAPEASPPPAEAIACDGQRPPEAGSEKPSFDEPEDQGLDGRKTWIWQLDTSCGRIEVKLAVDRAPKTANSIVFLTRQGYYEGLTFHRVVRDFVVQGGDPLGDGTGGPGYKVEEVPPEGTTYTRGIVAMAKGGAEPPGTSGSQFFVVVADSGLPAEYALVGEVISGMEAADQIVGYAGDGEAPPTAIAYIEKATIVEQ